MLEYLYKGDYTPRLAYDKKRCSWYLEDGATAGMGESTVNHNGVGGPVLKDTVIYVSPSLRCVPFPSDAFAHQCTAHRFSLPDLQRLALMKQGLQSGVQCSTILSSARFAYSHTPPSDSKLRAHYLALIIRSRDTFKRSGTLQMEMERGGSPLFFDLFVAMVNHLVSRCHVMQPTLADNLCRTISLAPSRLADEHTTSHCCLDYATSPRPAAHQNRAAGPGA